MREAQFEKKNGLKTTQLKQYNMVWRYPKKRRPEEDLKEDLKGPDPQKSEHTQGFIFLYLLTAP